jgi:hypothetical protein
LRVSPLDRGARATTADKVEVEALVSALAPLSVADRPAWGYRSLATVSASTLGEGRWNLVYTTSSDIIGGPLRPAGPLYLSFNSDEELASLDFSWPLRSERLRLSAVGRASVVLTPISILLLGFLPLPVRSWGRPRDWAELELLFLDADLKVMRGRRGSLFVLILDDGGYKVGQERGLFGSRALPAP